MRDIEAVLAEYNDEIGFQADKELAARDQAYRDLGGDELAILMKKKDQLAADETLNKAMDRIRKIPAMAETDEQKGARLLDEAADFIAATLPKHIDLDAWRRLLTYAPAKNIVLEIPDASV